jgi:hypothetical protein
MAFTWRFLWRLLTAACELVNEVSLASAQGLVSTFHYSVLLVCLGVGVVHANTVSYSAARHKRDPSRDLGLVVCMARGRMVA